MKVAYLLTDFPSRSETFAVREIEYLLREGWEVAVFAARRQPSSGAETRTIRAHYRPRAVSFKAIYGVCRLVRRYPLGLLRFAALLARVCMESPRESLSLLRNVHTIAFFIEELDATDIDHVHAYFLSWPARIALGIAAVTKKRMSCAAHARDIFVEAGAIKAKARSAEFIVVCTDQGTEDLKRRLPVDLHDRIHLVRHGVDGREQLSRSENEGQTKDVKEPNVILAVGRLVPKKGFDHLLRAFSQVREKLPMSRLVIAGDGPERARLTKLARSLDVHEHVDFCGWRDQYSILALMDGASVLAVPSVVADDGDRDGTPNVVLEAFRCGLAVVASSLPGIREAVTHQETGLLTTPAASEELADTLCRILCDDDLKERLVNAARLRLEREFSSDCNNARIVELMNESRLLRSVATV